MKHMENIRWIIKNHENDCKKYEDMGNIWFFLFMVLVHWERFAGKKCSSCPCLDSQRLLYIRVEMSITESGL